MVLTLESGQDIRGDLIRSAVMRTDLAPVPVTLEADILVDDDLARQLAQGKLIRVSGEACRIIKSVKSVERAAQGDHAVASVKLIALLDACQAVALVREQPISKERSTLQAIYRAAGASVQTVDGDFQVPRFTCLVGDTPTFHLARLLQEEGGVVRWKSGRLKFFRVADLFQQKPALQLPDNANDDVECGFRERHEVPWFYSIDSSGKFIYGNRGKARNAVFVPNTDERQLRNMTRCLIRQKVLKIAPAYKLCAGDLVEFTNGDKLAVITAAHVFESGTDTSGHSNTYTRLWLGKMAGDK